EVRQEINRKLYEREIKPSDIRHRKTGCCQHQPDIAITGNQTYCESARSSDAQKNKGSKCDHAKRPSAKARRRIRLRAADRRGKWSTTPSIAAIANVDIASTLRPSMRSRCASRNACPVTRRMIVAAIAQPAMIKKSLRPKASGETTAVPR